MKTLYTIFALLLAALLFACSKPADVASYNISQGADRFEINRRIIFVNGITDKYLLVVEGRCALGNNDKPREISVTCMVGPGTYLKNFVGLSDNVTYVVQQLEAAAVSTFHYKVIFRPETILPSISVE